MSKENLSIASRKCIATGEIFETKQMVRFVLSPDNVVTPDIKGALPGRGMWVQADKSALNLAVDKNLFSKSAKAKVIVPEDLVARTIGQLKKRIYDTMSLARRSGNAVTGFEKVKDMLKTKHCAIVVCAGDSTADSAEKLAGMCRMLEIEFFNGLSREELGKVFGRDEAIYAGFVKCGIAKTLKYETNRLQKLLSE